MKTIGLLGGMSWESTALYYRLANELVRDRLGGLASASLLVRSLDFRVVRECQLQDRWDDAAALLAAEARGLESAGAELVLLCTNYMHRTAPAIEAALSVPFARIPAGLEGLSLLERHGLEVLALSPSGGEVLSRLGRPARAAVLLGPEGPGLPAEVLARTRTVRIPMAGEFDSLNVATACGIALHHLAAG